MEVVPKLPGDIPRLAGSFMFHLFINFCFQGF
jgi:hypothetical protein